MLQTAANPASAALSAAGLALEARPAVCVHCGAPCRGLAVQREERHFCCHGCLTVFELLHENGLGDFYRLSDRPGVQVRQSGAADRFAFLDEPAVGDRLLDFAGDRTARITFQVPAIHCVACVWLLENLFKLRDGIGRSVVNFEKRHVTITIEPGKIRLSELAALLTSMGYEPTLRLDSLDQPRERSTGPPA